MHDWPLCEFAEQYSAGCTTIEHLIAMTQHLHEVYTGDDLEFWWAVCLRRIEGAAQLYGRALPPRILRAIRDEKDRQEAG